MNNQILEGALLAKLIQLVESGLVTGPLEHQIREETVKILTLRIQVGVRFIDWMDFHRKYECGFPINKVRPPFCD